MKVSKQQELFKKDLTTALAKAWEDESFKNELLANPKEAIESVTGRKLNLKDDFNIVVTDQSAPRTFYFNIPNMSNIESLELNEDQLELISGGSDYWKEYGLAGAAVDLFYWGFELGVELGTE